MTIDLKFFLPFSFDIFDLPFHALVKRLGILTINLKTTEVKCIHIIYIPETFSRHGQSQRLLYKPDCNSLKKSATDPFPPLTLQRCHAQTIGDCASGHKIDYVTQVKGI